MGKLSSTGPKSEGAMSTGLLGSGPRHRRGEQLPPSVVRGKTTLAVLLQRRQRPVGILGGYAPECVTLGKRNAQHHTPRVRVARRDKTSVLALNHPGNIRSAVGLSRTEQAALHFASLRSPTLAVLFASQGRLSSTGPKAIAPW